MQTVYAITKGYGLRKMLCSFICTLFFFISNSQGSFFKTSSFGAQAHYGSFITILPKAQYLRDSYTYFGEVFFQRNYKKLWAVDSQFVQWGSGIFFGNTGSRKYVGSMLGFFSFIHLPLLNKKNFQSRLRMGGGIGWIEKPYNKNTNHKNVLLGTALNAYLNFIWQNEFKLSPKTFVNLGLSFSHLSNGSSTLPNLGLNIPAFSIGIRYAAESSGIVIHKSIDSGSKKLSYYLYSSAGIKQHPWIGSNRYLVNTLSVEITKRTSYKYQYGGGVAIFYDRSLEVNPKTITSDKRKHNNLQLGIFGTYEYSIGKFSMPLQLGLTVFNHDVYSILFQQAGLRYKLSNRLTSEVILKAYGGKADMIHVGFGYKLK